MSILAKRRGLIIPVLCMPMLVMSTQAPRPTDCLAGYTEKTFYLPSDDNRQFNFTLTDSNCCDSGDDVNGRDMNELFINEIKTWLVDADNEIYYT